MVGIDQESDLALLKVVETGLPFLPLGDSEALRQGQIVVALGSPLGLEGSVTFGVVSAVARQVKPDGRMVYIQTDAPINPGNSGGPLLDAEGQVVGINSFILTQSGGSEGIGFAAPSNIVRTVIDQLRKTGRVRRGEIGVVAQTITPTLAAGLGLGQTWGVVLADVTPDGPGAAAGLRVADIVLTLDGKVTENARQFLVNLYPHAVGDTVILEVLRGTERRKVPVAVVERPSDPARLADLVSPERNVVGRLGILGLDLDDALLRRAGPAAGRGRRGGRGRRPRRRLRAGPAPPRRRHLHPEPAVRDRRGILAGAAREGRGRERRSCCRWNARASCATSASRCPSRRRPRPRS